MLQSFKVRGNSNEFAIINAEVETGRVTHDKERVMFGDGGLAMVSDN